MLVQRLEGGRVAAAVVDGEREEHPPDGGDVAEGVLEEALPAHRQVRPPRQRELVLVVAHPCDSDFIRTEKKNSPHLISPVLDPPW